MSFVCTQFGNFTNRTKALKRKSYEGLHHSVYEGPPWSYNFLSKLMGAENCVRLPHNSNCPEVHEGYFSHHKTDSD